MRAIQRLGIDVGGTFTDFVWLDESKGQIHSWKVPSTPSDPAQAVTEGVKAGGVSLSAIDLVVYGSTLGINTVIERRGATVGLFTTRGFEDILEIGWMSKPDMYNLFYSKPRPLVLRRNRIGIAERVLSDGQVLEEVNEAQVLEELEGLRSRGVTSLAISTINAYANPTNELRIGGIIQRAWPGAPLSVSHQIVNQRREYERTSTAVLNAYVAPVLATHLGILEDWLRAHEFGGTFYVMQSNGGIMTLKQARKTPVHTLLSGPVGGSAACQTIGKALGEPDLIGFDMGGTSTDISVVHGGRPVETAEALVEGLPLMSPVIDIDYIGSGGGSLCRIEGETSLRVGPESAGAEPGPVCYDRGGSQITVTDANLVLGRLASEVPLAGSIQLDLKLAHQAIEAQIAQPLSLDIDRAALGVLRIAVIKMAHAIRARTVGRGLDPRRFTLIAFGGAGPMHAAFVAQELGIPRVIVPTSPGNLSAWGMLNTDIRHDLARTIDYAGVKLSAGALKVAFDELETRGRSELESEGLPPQSIELRRAADMRYVGQEHTLTVPLPTGEMDDATVRGIIKSFHRIHEQRYSHANPEAEAEVVNIRLSAIGHLNPASYPKHSSGGPSPVPVGERRVTFEGQANVVPVFERLSLSPGTHLKGPAIVIESGSTTVLPPGFTLVVDRFGNLLIENEIEVQNDR